MNTLRRILLLLVVVCAVITVATQYEANAAARKDVYVTKRMSKVYPDLRTLERFVEVATFRPEYIRPFMRRNDVIEISKGTRVVKIRSVLLDGVDAVVYKVRIPSREEYGYVLARNVTRVKVKVKKPKKKIVIIDIL